MKIIQGYVKRIVDIILAVILLIILLPILLSLTLLVYCRMGRPVIFKQKRPGMNGVPFTLYKFRTMVKAEGGDGSQEKDENRLTSLGRFLRRTSLDELPEFWNVVKGDMSLVGPRPLLMEYLKLYDSKQARRHEVRPGITGWAQIHGRNLISWEDRFELDVWYVDHWSLFLDFRILMMTVLKVIRQEGISQQGRETMEKFKGSIQ